MARVEGYRCPITMRTTTIQPYDVPRFVSDIISQLHEIGHWTTRCCAVLNHTTPSSSTPAIISSTVTPRDARVPTTILTEMDLIKRNLNVVEKQHNTRLMSEIAYLQCALRSEAEEKMTDFERYVETKINQCVEEHTKKVRQEQMETSIALGNLQDGWRSMQSDVASLTQQLQKMQSTMEMAASRSVEMISTLHDQLKESSKLRDKHETSLGNQLSHVKLQLQESSQATKITVDQLTTRVDMARNEAKYAMDQLKLQIQQHARTLNRVAKGSNLFEMMSPVPTAPDNTSPQRIMGDESTRGAFAPPSKRRPMSARASSSSQPAYVQPAYSTHAFEFAQRATAPVASNGSFNIQGKMCHVSTPPDYADDSVDVACDGGNNQHSTAPPPEKYAGGTTQCFDHRMVPPCYVMEPHKRPNNDAAPQPTTFGLESLGKTCDQTRHDANDRTRPAKAPLTRAVPKAKWGPQPRQKIPQRPTSARPRPTTSISKASAASSKPVPDQNAQPPPAHIGDA
ncbi:hypothetical protein, variant 1 [Aphanomyces astaci]|uniref:Uncharacterized protein n=1 Tax=Aphanomyces astaci TaxID=112090 RepID=W4HDW6_APHAT|nr:hypothetical protein, variant 1 [Aphanomyces astaci]ETV89343.1 hypothetical protein, variant 1 [Aphanomyces astaci]|eukprot:XP_009821743.1 hypothetical protein, variant 1 [Aphanomyces astaci]